eukprot:364591-Chlamydomonas_euryale.AAC.4
MSTATFRCQPPCNRSSDKDTCEACRAIRCRQSAIRDARLLSASSQIVVAEPQRLIRSQSL